MAHVTPIRNFDLDTASRQDLINRINQLEEQVARLTSIAKEHRWLEKLIANPTLSGNDKTAIYGTHKAAKKREPREDGLRLVYRSDIAEHGGMEEQAVSNALKKLAKHDLVERKYENVRDKDTGQFAKHLFTNIDKFYEDPSVEIKKEPDEAGWGGKRVKICPDCGSTNLLEKHFYVCQNPECGCTIELDKVLEASEEALARDAALQEEVKAIQAQKEAEEAAAYYPAEIQALMDAQGIRRYERDCLLGDHREWLPAYNPEEDRWYYQCGHCYPFLMASQGRDLRKREGINE